MTGSNESATLIHRTVSCRGKTLPPPAAESHFRHAKRAILDVQVCRYADGQCRRMRSAYSCIFIGPETSYPPFLDSIWLRRFGDAVRGPGLIDTHLVERYGLLRPSAVTIVLQNTTAKSLSSKGSTLSS